MYRPNLNTLIGAWELPDERNKMKADTKMTIAKSPQIFIGGPQRILALIYSAFHTRTKTPGA